MDLIFYLPFLALPLCYALIFFARIRTNTPALIDLKQGDFVAINQGLLGTVYAVEKDIAHVELTDGSVVRCLRTALTKISC